MELIESLPKLSEDKVWEIVVNCCKTLSAIGPEFEVSEADFERGQFYEATGLQGQTILEVMNGSFFQQLRFNSNLFREGLEDAYLNTIYHELIHVIVNKYIVKNNFVEITRGNMFHIVNKEEWAKIHEDNGHGGRWLELAVRANKVLGLKLPITPYCSEREFEAVFNASIEDNQEAALEIRCQACGSGMSYLTVNMDELPSIGCLMQLYYDTKHQKQNNVCKKCHGTMYIIIRDQKLKNFLEDKLGMFEFLMSMKNLFGA